MTRRKQFISPASLAAALLLTIGITGCAPSAEKEAASGEKAGAEQSATQPIANTAFPVRVATATRDTVTRTVAVTGNLTALQTVSLAPKLNARVLSISGREGEPVRRGQVVVRQDPSDFRVQLEQAEANLKSAKARLTQAEAGYQSAKARLAQAETQARLQVIQSQAGVEDAEQQVKSAEAQLEIAKRPQRTQEVEVAENGVAQAQANYDKAKTDLTRYETLVKEGAVAQSVLDQYVNQERVSKAALDSAKKQLEIAKVGGRDENVRNAESALARAQWALRVAKANKVQVNVRQDDVKAAKAGVAQAEAEIRAARATVAQSQAAVSNAQLQLADTEIRSPIDGVIASRLTEPGQMAGPASPVVQLVALDTVFFEAQVPETDLATIGAGLSVDVKTDAFPNKTFAGKIARIYPTGNTASRTVVLRVEIANANKMLRPGLFARGVIIAERREGVVVPKDAIVRADGKLYIFVAEGGSRAVRREVRTGIEDVTTIEIVSGVNTGETVIVSGQGALEDGATIKVEDEKRQTAAL